MVGIKPNLVWGNMKIIENKIKDNYILLIILFLGLILRIYNLGTEGFWVDEGFSSMTSRLSLFQIVQQTSQDSHPPLYYFILHYWIHLFGVSEFSTRFLSVIFGFFAILMIYVVGTLIFNKNVGIISSLILALSVFHIHFSQEARMYSLLTLLTLLSMYFFIKLIHGVNHKFLIGYILSSILLMYTHYFGLVILITQNIYFFTMFLFKEENKLSVTKWILLQIILAVLYIPWINFILTSMSAFTDHVTWVVRPGINSLISTFSIYSGRKLNLPLFLIVSLFSILSSIATYKKFEGKFNGKQFLNYIKDFSWNINISNANKIYFLLLWLLTTILLPFIISLFKNPIYDTRFTIAASLSFYILIAKGIDNINNKHIKVTVILLIIIFSLNAVGREYTTINRQQCREVADYIDNNVDPGDLLLYTEGFTHKYCFDYYSKRTDLNKKSFPEKSDMVMIRPVRLVADGENIKELRRMVEGYDRVFLLLYLGVDPKGLIENTLNVSYNLSYRKEYEGEIRISKYTTKNES